LFDASIALLASDSMEAALVALAPFDAHRFGPLLHRYELSNWVLYARAYGRSAATPELRAHDLDRLLRAAPDPLSWLTKEWVLPALARPSARGTSPLGKATVPVGTQ